MKDKLYTLKKAGRTPLAIRRRLGVIYFQTQIQIAREDGLSGGSYCYFHKTNKFPSEEDVGLLAIVLLEKFHSISDLTEQEFFEMKGIDFKSYEGARKNICVKFHNAKDGNDLNRNYDSCHIYYDLESDSYSMGLSWVYREGKKYWNDSSDWSGKKGVLTFKEPLEFKEFPKPEVLGAMIIEALDRSHKIAVAMSGDYLPDKTVDLFDGNYIRVVAPKDKHFSDLEDGGVGECYQVYSYLPNEYAEDSSADFFLDCCPGLIGKLNAENLLKTLEGYEGKGESYDFKEIQHGIFTHRAEFRNKKVYQISYFLELDDGCYLQCGMFIYQPNRRKKLVDTLPPIFEDFAFGCKFTSESVEE